MYKIFNNPLGTAPCGVTLDNHTSIPFNPDNTDYQRFKADVNEGSELQDSEGVVMTPEAAKAFIQTLP